MTVLDTEAGTGASGGSAVLGDLVAKLAQLIEVDDAELDVDVPLINLGADSIILLEAMAYLEDTYRVEILASQLVEELSTLRLLAGHIERTRADQPTNGAAERPGHREQPEHLEHPEQPVRPGPILDLRTDRSRPEAAPEQPIRTVADRVAVAGDEQASSFVSWTPQHTEAPVTTDAPSPELVATHHDRLRASKAHADRYRSTHADPRSVASFRRPLKELVVPVVANRADGALLWDLDGNELLDMAMGFGSLLLGHNHPAIRNAVAHQLDAISGVGPVSFLGGPLSERISDLTGHQRVSFVTTGTEAVMLALRLARTATGRRKVALFRGAYHGWWDGSLAVPGRDPGDARRATAGTIGDAADDLLLLDWDDASALDLIERHRDELAAVVAEPVQSRRPGCHCGAFLADLRSLTRSSGALLVFDEMITGFRLSAGGAAEHFGVRPDLVTYGKALGGGLPLAAVAGRADVMDLLDGGAWTFGDDSAPATPATFGAGTYAKHPLSMAAAWAFVTEVETRGPDLYEDLEQAGARVERGANAVFERHGVPATLERCGSMMRFMSRRNLDALFGWLLVEGVYLWEGRTMFLSTAHGPDEIDRFVAALDRACGQLTGPNRRPEDPAPSRPAEPAGTEVAASPDDIVVELPLTPNQQQLSFAYGYGSDVAEGFHNVAVVSLEGPLDVDALGSAIAQLVRRHDSMRSTFDLDRGVEQVHATSRVSLEVADLRHDQRTSSLAIDDEIRQACTAPFDLRNGPLWRLRLVRQRDHDARLVLACSDLVADGWSLGVVVTELAPLYDAAVAGTPAELPDAPTLARFRALTGGSRAANGSPSSEPAPALDDVGTLDGFDLTTPLPPSTGAVLTSYVKTRAKRTITTAAMASIRSAAAGAGATPTAALLGTFAALVHLVGGRTEFVLGIPTHGRPEAELRGIVASLAVPAAIPIRVDRATALGDLIRGAQRAVFAALDHPVPIEVLARRQAVRTGTLAPVTPVMFNLDPIPEIAPLHGGLRVRINTPERTFGLVPFSAELCPANDGATLVSFDAAEELYEHDMVECWADYYLALLDQLPDALDRPIGSLSLRGRGG